MKQTYAAHRFTWWFIVAVVLLVEVPTWLLTAYFVGEMVFRAVNNW